jgi:hypothetical protein
MNQRRLQVLIFCGLFAAMRHELPTEAESIMRIENGAGKPLSCLNASS